MKHLNKLGDTAKLIFSVIILSAAFTVASAWTNRPSNPPADNTPPPINVGTIAQSKDGNIGAKTILADSVGVGDTVNVGAVSAPKFCIGSACITSWPAVDDSGLPALSCVDVVVTKGSGTAECAAINATCTSRSVFSDFEWFPRGCAIPGGGNAVCCRLGSINYTPPPPPPPPPPCDPSDPTSDCYAPLGSDSSD